MKDVLIIHDDPLLVNLLPDMLDAGGHRPKIVTDPLGGWDYLKGNSADALVTKVGFPGWKPHGLAIAQMGIAGGKTSRILIVDDPGVLDRVDQLNGAKVATLPLNTPVRQIVETLESLLA